MGHSPLLSASCLLSAALGSAVCVAIANALPHPACDFPSTGCYDIKDSSRESIDRIVQQSMEDQKDMALNHLEPWNNIVKRRDMEEDKLEPILPNGSPYSYEDENDFVGDDDDDDDDGDYYYYFEESDEEEEEEEDEVSDEGENTNFWGGLWSGDEKNGYGNLPPSSEDEGTSEEDGYGQLPPSSAEVEPAEEDGDALPLGSAEVEDAPPEGVALLPWWFICASVVVGAAAAAAGAVAVLKWLRSGEGYAAGGAYQRISIISGNLADDKAPLLLGPNSVSRDGKY